MVAAPTRCGAVEKRQTKVAGECVDARCGGAIEQKYMGTAVDVVGPVEQALAGHSQECSAPVGILLDKLGEQGYVDMGCRSSEVGVAVATWAIRREWVA